MTKKITKRENYEALLALLPEMLNAELINEEMDARLAEFLNKEIETLDKRAASAKKYAEKSKAKADELAEMVETVLMNENRVMTIPEIVETALAHEANCGATPQKVAYRLTKMVEAGRVAKETVSVKEEGKNARKVNAYHFVWEEQEG